jgi:excisionase family DNA binding protein
MRIHKVTSRYTKGEITGMSSNIRLEKVCQHCGEKFIAKTTVTQCCGDDCAKRAYKRRKRQEKIDSIKEVDHQLIDYRVKDLRDKEFLSIRETCQLLGASRMTVYRQIKSGYLPAIKFGRRTIIMKSEIHNLFYNES